MLIHGAFAFWGGPAWACSCGTFLWHLSSPKASEIPPPHRARAESPVNAYERSTTPSKPLQTHYHPNQSVSPQCHRPKPINGRECPVSHPPGLLRPWNVIRKSHGDPSCIHQEDWMLLPSLSSSYIAKPGEVRPGQPQRS